MSSVRTELTIMMLEVLFRGRDLTRATDYLLPNGQAVSGYELRALFDDYITT